MLSYPWQEINRIVGVPQPKQLIAFVSGSEYTCERVSRAVRLYYRDIGAQHMKCNFQLTQTAPIPRDTLLLHDVVIGFDLTKILQKIKRLSNNTTLVICHSRAKKSIEIEADVVINVTSGKAPTHKAYCQCWKKPITTSCTTRPEYSDKFLIDLPELWYFDPEDWRVIEWLKTTPKVSSSKDLSNSHK